MNFMVLAILIIWLSQCTTDLQEGCKSPQYLELGERGTLECSFREGFLGVFWYESEDFANDEPVLSYKDSEISGAGYISGELSIWPNGSLIINNVSIANVHVYTAIKLDTLHDDPFPHIVNVITTVTPKQPFPVITECGNDHQVCLSSLNPGSGISCYVYDARPTVHLHWFERTTTDDKKIFTETNVTSEGNLMNTSQITTKFYFNDDVWLKLLVCKVISSPSLLQQIESMVLVQRNDRNLPTSTPILKYFEKNSKLILLCTDTNILFLVWSALRSPSDFENIAYAIFADYNALKAFSEDFKLDSNGSLVISQVQFQHEGFYSCMHSNGVHEDVKTYEAVIYVSPDSVYPVVEECGDEDSCFLKVDYTGELTCLVKGIHPQVELEWIVVDKRLAGSITFENKEKFIKESRGLFDVSLKTTYHTNVGYQKNITVQCRVSGKHAQLFDLERSIDLLFATGNVLPVDETKPRMKLWSLVAVPVLIILLVILGVVICKSRDIRRHTASEKTECDDGKSVHSQETPFLSPSQDLSDKKRTFITELKRKYENLYAKVLPIPYISDISFRVDKVFINSGIEFLPSSGHDTWERLISYQCMFEDSRVQSKRIIIEGFPGYGKSTLLLQIAYDWYHQASGSSLDDVEILILLPLRNITSMKSLFQAIKELLLPRDTQLSESDIRNIVHHCSSVVILLDGYDEYPDKESNEETDIKNIIEMKMLQECCVIFTTRPPHLPSSRSSNTTRLRLLGFDEGSRFKYILKSVTKNETDAIKIEQRLKSFPILMDLCESPLIFAMFAHVPIQKDKEQDVQFNSVTIYFHYIVTCLHTHLQNKTEDKMLRAKYENFEAGHCSLNEVAFENLRNIEHEFVSEKEKLIENLGKDVYEFYVRIGILMEEEVITTFNRSSVVQIKTKVRFYHRLFHEWYAAHFLASNIVSKESTRLLKKHPVAEFPDVYRFACGLNREAANKIIQYLDKIGSDNFKLLCLVERDGKVDNLIKTLGEECAEDVCIRNDDDILKQKSTLQLIKIASHHKIPIKSVWLWYSFSSVDQSAKNIILKSGLTLPNLQAIKEIVILEEGREITEIEAVPVFDFVVNCKTLTSLGFTRCLLPPSFQNESSLNLLKSCSIDVWWYPIMTSPRNHLNLETGRWKDGEDGTDISEASYHEKESDFRYQWSYTPWQKTRRKQLQMDTSSKTV